MSGERLPVCPCPSFSLHSYSICSTGTQVWRSEETIALPVWGLARTLPLCPENQTIIIKKKKATLAPVNKQQVMTTRWRMCRLRRAKRIHSVIRSLGKQVYLPLFIG